MLLAVRDVALFSVFSLVVTYVCTYDASAVSRLDPEGLALRSSKQH